MANSHDKFSRQILTANSQIRYTEDENKDKKKTRNKAKAMRINLIN